MKLNTYLLSFFFSALLLPVNNSFSHGGRTDSKGGHYNRKTGEYHYHSGSSTSGKESSINFSSIIESSSKVYDSLRGIPLTSTLSFEGITWLMRPIKGDPIEVVKIETDRLEDGTDIIVYTTPDGKENFIESMKIINLNDIIQTIETGKLTQDFSVDPNIYSVKNETLIPLSIAENKGKYFLLGAVKKDRDIVRPVIKHISTDSIDFLFFTINCRTLSMRIHLDGESLLKSKKWLKIKPDSVGSGIADFVCK